LFDNVKGRDHLRDLGLDGKVIQHRILGKQGWTMWTGCMWLRTQTRGGRFEHGNELPVSTKRWGISWLSEWLSASQKGFCITDL